MCMHSSPTRGNHPLNRERIEAFGAAVRESENFRHKYGAILANGRLDRCLIKSVRGLNRLEQTALFTDFVDDETETVVDVKWNSGSGSKVDNESTGSENDK